MLWCRERGWRCRPTEDFLLNLAPASISGLGWWPAREEYTRTSSSVPCRGTIGDEVSCNELFSSPSSSRLSSKRMEEKALHLGPITHLREHMNCMDI